MNYMTIYRPVQFPTPSLKRHNMPFQWNSISTQHRTNPQDCIRDQNSNPSHPSPDVTRAKPRLMVTYMTNREVRVMVSSKTRLPDQIIYIGFIDHSSYLVVLQSGWGSGCGYWETPTWRSMLRRTVSLVPVSFDTKPDLLAGSSWGFNCRGPRSLSPHCRSLSGDVNNLIFTISIFTWCVEGCWCRNN